MAALAAPFVDGAAAIVFAFSFFGFFVSRLPRCSPLGITPLLLLPNRRSSPSKRQGESVVCGAVGELDLTSTSSIFPRLVAQCW
jgi:hypothetical protein